MEHLLINTIIASLVTAFVFGVLAKKLKLPVIFGYLLAGVAIGPYTPGYVGDVSLAKQLAEIGIILLMFGVGLHFSLKDLMRVRQVALPGAVVQMACATVVGAMVAKFLGYSAAEGMIFGFSLSVASTIVLLRALEQRNLVDGESGKLAIGWLIIEDIAMVLALVTLPVLAGGAPSLPALSAELGMVLLKICVFFVVMLWLGRRFLPRLLQLIAKLDSAELSLLGTLAIAMGFASIAYVVFDASFALGAFLAGVVLSESEIGRRSAESSLPMRDAFGVLFFVSVGMLFDPMTLVNQPLAVALTFLVIVVAKGAAALAICLLFRLPRENGYAVALGLAQIGEFSFILGGLAVTHGMLPEALYNLILAGAMLSVLANPFLFRLYDAKYGEKNLI